MMSFKKNAELRTHSIVTTFDSVEGKLSFDDAFLNAAQHFGLEIDLFVTKKGF